MLEDFQRHLTAVGMQAEPGPFADSKKACMGLLFAQEHGKDQGKDQGKGTPYHNAVFRARWLEEKDIGHAETLAAIAERVGLGHPVATGSNPTIRLAQSSVAQGGKHTL